MNPLINFAIRSTLVWLEFTVLAKQGSKIIKSEAYVIGGIITSHQNDKMHQHKMKGPL